jgi:hypothetical protein
MTELEQFRATFSNKSKITQGVYNSNYKKLRDLLGDDVVNVSQKKVIELLEENISNRNSQSALLNVAYLIRKNNDMAIQELESFRKKNQTIIKDKIYETNTKLVDSLPSYATLVDYTDNLLKNEKYMQYVINYLLLYCQVRNADLVFDFVLFKRDTKDKNKNYLWFSSKSKTVHYIRNVYKTAKIVKPDGTTTGYGQKIIKITDSKFIKVMKILVNQEKKENKPTVFIANSDNIAYQIKKMTYEGLGETLYFKIVVNHFRTDVNMLKQISYNRGTDINTILESYDIESEEIEKN